MGIIACVCGRFGWTEGARNKPCTFRLDVRSLASCLSHYGLYTGREHVGGATTTTALSAKVARRGVCNMNVLPDYSQFLLPDSCQAVLETAGCPQMGTPRTTVYSRCHEEFLCTKHRRQPREPKEHLSWHLKLFSPCQQTPTSPTSLPKSFEWSFFASRHLKHRPPTQLFFSCAATRRSMGSSLHETGNLWQESDCQTNNSSPSSPHCTILKRTCTVLIQLNCCLAAIQTGPQLCAPKHKTNVNGLRRTPTEPLTQNILQLNSITSQISISCICANSSDFQTKVSGVTPIMTHSDT